MWLAAALLAATLCPSSSTTETTPWADVCTSEQFASDKVYLCPAVFLVSTLAFNPNSPGAEANVTLIIQPSSTLTSSTMGMQYVYLHLPGFLPIGEKDPDNEKKRLLQTTGRNLASIGESYNTYDNGVFEEYARWDTENGFVELQVKAEKSVLANVDTEIEICCLVLPSSSEKDSKAYEIWAPYGEGASQQNVIQKSSIQSSAYIDPGSQWGFLQVTFQPAVSKQPTVISLTVRPADDLADQTRIVFYLPTISRASGMSGNANFSTTGGDSDDWLLFAHHADWNEQEHKLTFFLRDGKTLASGRQVTLQTRPGDFVLPVEMDANWPQLKVEARSRDDVDEIIRASPVMQSSGVPHVRTFTNSEVSYTNGNPGATTDVLLTFRTNRPMYAGTKLYLRLSGFQSEVIEVPLLGPHISHFKGSVAHFHLTLNLLEFTVVSTLYSNEADMQVTIAGLIVPPALYENDESLLIWNSDFGAQRQPIAKSPEVGDGLKRFVQSQVSFNPKVPNEPANITFTLKPSIIFFQDDQVMIYLYGFKCTGTRLPLVGPDADKVLGRQGVWNPAEFTLTLTVGENKIISNSVIFNVTVGSYELADGSLHYPCTLPAKLTQDDGVLRVEGRGAVIHQEPMKKSPAIGSPKFILDSKIEFEAHAEDESHSCGGDKTAFPAKVDIFIVLNCDVLPNTTFYVKLGGLERDHSEGVLQEIKIKLSGANAPLFVDNHGIYYPESRMLAVTVIRTMWVYAGEKIKFFLERDQCFRLPFAAYANDPSYQIYIPEAGIPSTPFNYSSRVNVVPKGFDTSLLYFGNSTEYIAYPNTVEEINIKFTPNVKIFGGSTIKVVLTGFVLAKTQVQLASPITPLANEEDLSFRLAGAEAATWEQQTYTLTIKLAVTHLVGDAQEMQPYTLPTNKLAVIRIPRSQGFRLPKDSLMMNDPGLKISCVSNQIIYEEQIKESPLVVDRTFDVSTFTYYPPMKGSIFHFKIQLRPTVDIIEENTLKLTLEGFYNPLPAKNTIHITGQNASSVGTLAYWNSTTSLLTMTLSPGVVMAAFSDFEIEIEESQGFVLPDALGANDTRLKIEAEGNIREEPVKFSPMVGNGPFENHRFCMYQFERGVRTVQSICPEVSKKLPPLLDPCSDEELIRPPIVCERKADTPQPLRVQGFNLQKEDKLRFVPYEDTRECSVDPADIYVLHPFTEPTSSEVTDTENQVNYHTYHDISSIQTGKFRICVDHVGVIFDIGFVIVRPSCQSPLVMVDGTCVEHCPKTKAPIVGECQRDPHALAADDTQAVMLSVKMTYDIGGAAIYERPTEDPELKYFVYMYTYEMAGLLRADPSRIKVVSLSNGSSYVVVNTVFTPVADGDAVAISKTGERSPRALVSLLQRLMEDTSSSLHQKGSFFVDIDRTYHPDPIKVRLCPDNTFRVFCPYTGEIMKTNNAVYFFMAGAVLMPVLLTVFCACAWFIDLDSKSSIDPDILEKVRENPKSVEAPQRAEYAKSWLEGRFMGEDWQRSRNAKLFAIGN